MKIAVIGGHVAPALGFIDALPKSASVVYIGRQHTFEGDTGISFEQQVMKKKGIPFFPIKTGRIQRVITPYTIRSFLKIPGGFLEALTLLRTQKPDVVVGFGGYLSVPVGITAFLLKIPLVIHESSLESGLANKMLAPFAKKVCVSWETNLPFFPKEKTIMTGNPLLPFDTATYSITIPAGKLPLVVVTGGSGGSHAINMLVAGILPKLLSFARVIHQVGNAQEFKDYKKLLSQKNLLPKNVQERYTVAPFIQPEEVNAILRKADLVIGRSGINTVAALLVLHKKSICIPLPSGQHNEQLNNAKLLESAGLGKILMQDSLTSEKLLDTIQEVLTNHVQPAPKWEIPVIRDGARRLVEEVLACASTHEE